METSFGEIAGTGICVGDCCCCCCCCDVRIGDPDGDPNGDPTEEGPFFRVEEEAEAEGEENLGDLIGESTLEGGTGELGVEDELSIPRADPGCKGGYSYNCAEIGRFGYSSILSTDLISAVNSLNRSCPLWPTSTSSHIDLRVSLGTCEAEARVSMVCSKATAPEPCVPCAPCAVSNLVNKSVYTESSFAVRGALN